MAETGEIYRDAVLEASASRILKASWPGAWSWRPKLLSLGSQVVLGFVLERETSSNNFWTQLSCDNFWRSSPAMVNELMLH